MGLLERLHPTEKGSEDYSSAVGPFRIGVFSSSKFKKEQDPFKLETYWVAICWLPSNNEGGSKILGEVEGITRDKALESLVPLIRIFIEESVAIHKRLLEELYSLERFILDENKGQGALDKILNNEDLF